MTGNEPQQATPDETDKHGGVPSFHADRRQPDRTKGRMLLVENDPDLRRLIEQYLTRNGLAVISAANGYEALSLASHEFDLVLLDLQMPRLDGETTARRLREWGYQGAIIAFSGETPGRNFTGDIAGISSFVSKSVTLECLLAICLENLPATSSRRLDKHCVPPLAVPNFSDLRRKYVRRLSGTVDDLHAALARDDRSTLRHMAHRIIGTSGLYGLQTISEWAKRLHSAASPNDPADELEATVLGLGLAVRQFARPSDAKGLIEHPRGSASIASPRRQGATV